MSVPCRNAAALAVVLLGPLLGIGGCAFPGLSGSAGGPKLVRPQVKPLPDNISTAKTPAILPETHFAAARLFEARGLVYRAIGQYRRVIAVSHEHAEAHHRLGLLLSLAGQRDEAVKMLRRAVLLRPSDAVFRNNLGFELILAKKFVEGEEQLRRAIAMKGDFARAHVNLGIALSKRGRFAEALASFQQVLPEPDAYYNLGLLYEGESRFADAISAFERAVSIDAEFTSARQRIERLAAKIPSEPAVDPDASVPWTPVPNARTAQRLPATKIGDASLDETDLPKTTATILASNQDTDFVRSAQRSSNPQTVANAMSSARTADHLSASSTTPARPSHRSGVAHRVATPAPKRRGQTVRVTDVDELLELIEREITPWKHAVAPVRRAKVEPRAGRAQASSSIVPNVWPTFDVDRRAASAPEIARFGRTADRAFSHHQPPQLD